MRLKVSYLFTLCKVIQPQMLGINSTETISEQMFQSSFRKQFKASEPLILSLSLTPLNTVYTSVSKKKKKKTALK